MLRHSSNETLGVFSAEFLGLESQCLNVEPQWLHIEWFSNSPVATLATVLPPQYSGEEEILKIDF